MAKNENLTIEGKAKVDRRKSSLYESGARKRLADISNFPKQSNLDTGVGKSHFLPNSDNVYSDKLQKENTSLLKLLEEKNKIIELSGSELQKLVVNVRSLQQQNFQLAQANSQMFAELNVSKDRLKAMQHQLGCTNSLLRVKEMEQKENLNVTICQQCQAKVGTSTCEKDVLEIMKGNRNQSNLLSTNRNLPRESQTGSGHSNVNHLDSMEKTKVQSVCLRAQSASCQPEVVGPEKEVVVLPEEKAENKRVRPRRNSAIFKHKEPKSEDMALTKEMTENKRVCSRKDSAHFKHEEPNLKEEEIVGITDNAKLPDCPSSLGSHEGSIGQSLNSNELRRSSIARPSRLAAQKVQSYKEVPVNVKMRRPE